MNEIVNKIIDNLLLERKSVQEELLDWENKGMMNIQLENRIIAIDSRIDLLIEKIQ